MTAHGGHFRLDPSFRAAYERGVKAGLGVDPHFEWRVHVALWAARRVLSADGDLVECGVNAGFISSAIMQNLRWATIRRRYDLIDTFRGPVLRQYSQEEVEKQRARIAIEALGARAYVTDMDRVRENTAEWPNSIVMRGAVPEVLDGLKAATVAFLHIDMNCASPERAALEFFCDRLPPGAVVLLDDYAYYGHDCQRDAMDTAARSLGTEVLSLPTAQGLIVK